MTATREGLVPPPVTLRIGSERLTEGSGGSADHVNPVTGRADAVIPLAGSAEVDRAVRVAQEAFEAWRATPGAERARILGRLADLIERRAEDLARLGALDNGTPVQIVRGAVPTAAGWVRYYAGWADKIPLGRVNTLLTSENEFGYTLRQPYGVIGAIITWNAPLISLCMKVPAALAAGNAVVVKPSELTPFTAMLFADLAEEAGLPAGVLNVLPGAPEAGEALVRHPLVKKISFTGGPETARRITAACAEVFKPVVLELGGKSANIVFDDAPLQEAAMQAAFMGLALQSGQVCAIPSRLLVQDGIYEEFVQQVAQIAQYLKVGDPLEEDTVSGPVISAAAIERIEGMVERAAQDGARLVTGGSRLGGDLADGYFFQPTIFADVDPRSELAQKEVFGPVMAVLRFSTEDEAVAIANATDFGLSGYVWSGDGRRALRVAERLNTGEVMVNGAVNASFQRPFGGINHSGMGREGGVEGLDEFLWTKSVAVGGGRPQA